MVLVDDPDFYNDVLSIFLLKGQYMDILSFYYFKELAKDLHMTKTASRLYISQQTLSNRILRMEEELGTPLFYRKPSLSLTPAGEYVLNFAKQITSQYANLQDLISDMTNEESGVLRFGASTLRIDTCIGPILKDFSAKYPRVELRVTDSISGKLVPKILEGELDLAIVSTDNFDVNLVHEQFMTDHIFFCVTDGLLEEYYGEEASALKKKAWAEGAHVSDFDRLPFCMFTSRLGAIVRECFEDEHVRPKVYIDSTYTNIATNICFRGLAASFCTNVVLNNKRRDIPRELNIIPLKKGNDVCSLKLSLIRHRDRYQPEYTRYFSDLICDYFSRIESTPMTQLGDRIPAEV